ncbi:MAG: RNA polymerase sigma-54 factor [Crocinitomicaceae bacterium]|nr:RNA polymerase sigma-54 factor [Crocinitomicaceae bacterium]|tara:strand:- start:31 stop:1461 length:1431 start_codon:yes stop_codon:yes gene_type:complete
MALKQSLQQRLLQKLSPQQIQLMKMLQLPTVELEKRIKEELEINPALDEGEEQVSEDEFTEEADDKRDDFNFQDYTNDETPSYKTQSNNFSKGQEEHQKPLSFGDSLSERLLKQIDLKIKNENQKKIAEHIIGNLDESGYLRRELFNIVDDLAFSQNIFADEEELEQILAEVQDLEPHGVGARDLKECLLIQLRKKNKTIAIKTAEVILEKCFESFTKKHYSKISKKLDINNDAIKDAIAEIVKLNPKPGNSLIDSQSDIQQITPDFTLIDNDGILSVELNQRNSPQLRVSNDYIEMIKGFQQGAKNKRDKDAILFIKQKVDAAKWFIDAVKQRQNTLLITMKAIISFQKEFFLSGDEKKLKPMILKDIASIVSMDISTISRVANSKHVSTPYGIFSLKYFFSESLTTDSGEEVSTREVKTILNEAINKEDKSKPLTDEKLASLLKEKGYLIARRTVAKYREQLNIPVARLRKELL